MAKINKYWGLVAVGALTAAAAGAIAALVLKKDPLDDFDDFDDEDFELEDLEALRETIDDLIDRKNAREFDGDEETDDDLDSFVVSMQDFDKDEPKLEDSVIVDEEK